MEIIRHKRNVRGGKSLDNTLYVMCSVSFPSQQLPTREKRCRYFVKIRVRVRVQQLRKGSFKIKDVAIRAISHSS